MVYKIIVAGRLEFGSEKTFKKVLDMYNFRVENFYKFDLLFKEEVFDHENFHLNIPRLVKHSEEKSWANTLKLLEYLAEFAVSGSVMLWKVDDSSSKKKVTHKVIEPHTDKAAVKNFLKGRALIDQKGKEDEAIKALSKAIEKYERHSFAYERRGLVNFKFKNYKDAIYDFSKSIDLNPNNPLAYYGRAKVRMVLDEKELAAKDFTMAAKTSIPLQSIHIKARRQKAELLVSLGQEERAEVDLKFLSNRTYEESDPFYPYHKSVCYAYGKLLLKLEKPVEAISIFEKVMAMPDGNQKIGKADLLLDYGVSLQKAGKKGFKKNWKNAAELGSKKAKDLLIEFA